MPRVLLILSTTVTRPGHNQRGPRKDYAVLAEHMQATILDRSAVAKSSPARLLRFLFGTPVAQAWLAFRQRAGFDVLVTDGEHIGIPLALLLKIAASSTAHVTIGHRLTATKKSPFFRWLKVHRHMSRIAVHSKLQYDLAIDNLGIEPDRLALVPYQVDTEFWQSQPIAEERLICSAGLEFRDYPTLVQAVDQLDVQVVIGAASHWSKRANTAASAAAQSANVLVDSFDYVALREVYARASIVVVPLDDVDFQAGITTILEAMAMSKPVIVTHTRGQTDVVEDRRTSTRGATPRERPVSLLRRVAALEGVQLEPSGFYVPPHDPEALRRAIVHLLDNPDQRRELGAAGRRAVERLLTVDKYAARLGALVAHAASTHSTTSPALSRSSAASN
jgi:glycosyltransferase involved in cell wall biosynthesis